jgi:hypothetical protein
MRNSIVLAMFALIVAGAAVVGAQVPPANNVAIKGANESLFAITQDIITLCDGRLHGSRNASGNILFPNLGITYIGGSGTNGAAAMILGQQGLTPMTRPLTAAEYCQADSSDAVSAAEQDASNAIVIGVDGISVFVDSTEACGTDMARSGRAFPYISGSVTHTYAVLSSLDVLRLIYAGTDHNGLYTGDYGCGGPIRQALVLQWGNLFNSSCGSGKCDGSSLGPGLAPQPFGITHAWRRADLADTTDAFASLVGLGSRHVGASPFLLPYNNASYAVNPFCNSIDANAASTATPCNLAGRGHASDVFSNGLNIECQTDIDMSGGPDERTWVWSNPRDGVCEAGFCRPGSLGGTSDYSDADSIRIVCDSDPVTGADNDNVCGNDGTLGLVLPIVLPDNPDVTLTEAYPPRPCEPTSPCVLGLTGDPSLPCPRGGPKILGRCYQPTYMRADHTPGFNCLAQSFTKCFADQGVDGRAYNLPVKHEVPPGQVDNGTYVFDENENTMTGAFFRIHMRTPASYAPVGTAPCTEADNGHQTACLTDADPCSVGIAEDSTLLGGSMAPISIQKLSIDGVLSAPSANLTNVFDGVLACSSLSPSCPTGFTCNPRFQQCFPTGEAVYPLAERLFVSSIYGLGSLPGGEEQLALCLGDNNLLGMAVPMHFALTIPAGPATGRRAGAQCVDYPGMATTTPLPLLTPPSCKNATVGGANANGCIGPGAPPIH